MIFLLILTGNALVYLMCMLNTEVGAFARSFSAIIIFYLVCLVCDGVAILEPGGAAPSVGAAPEAIFCISIQA